MNKLYKYLFLICAIFMMGVANAQVDRTKAPEAGPAPKIKIGDYKSFTLKNGMKVLVVENHKLPKVTFSLSLNINPLLEGDKAGYVSIAGDMLEKGTSKRSAQQLAEEIDFIGARLGTGSRGAYASGLSRYKETIIELFSDVILNPSFPEVEFKKIVKQTLSGLKANETDPGAIAQNMKARVVYGKDHPYGDVETPKTINAITLDDCKEYYNTYFKPNVAILAIVGDITLKEAKKLVKEYLGGWKSGEVPSITYAMPAKIKGKRVVLSHKEAAPQSKVQVVYPVALKKGDVDVIPVKVMNAMLGRGFMGLLTKNLREDKGYTYGAGSSLYADRLVGEFHAGASVRASVTDSSFMEIVHEMNHICNQKMTQDHLNMTKATLAGDFARSLEDPSTIAGFAMAIEKYNLPKDYYNTYLERLSKITLDDVQAMAKKYIHTDNAVYLVVGDRGLKDKLSRLSSTNKVEEYDHQGNLVKVDPNAIPEGMTSKKIIDHYLQAIGGRDNVNKIKDMTMKGEMKMGAMSINVESCYKNNEKFAMKMTMNGQVVQSVVFNGTLGRMVAMGQKKVLEGDDAKSLKVQALIIPEMTFEQQGVKTKIMGAEKVDGQKAIKVEVVTLDKKKRVEFYGLKSGLKMKTVASQNGTTQIIRYKDYREVNGVKFPFSQVTSVGPQEMPLTINEMKVNIGVSDEMFN